MAPPSLNSAKSLLNLCKLFKMEARPSLLVGATPLAASPKGEFNIGIVGKVFFLLTIGLAASVDNGRVTATELKPLRNLSSPPFLSPVGTTVKIVIKSFIIKS